MAIAFKVYSPSYNTTKTIYVDFVGEKNAELDPNVTNYYWKITLPGLQMFDGSKYEPSYILQDLSTFPIAGTHQYLQNSTSPYTDIDQMISDWLAYLIDEVIADRYHTGDPGKYNLDMR